MRSHGISSGWMDIRQYMTPSTTMIALIAQQKHGMMCFFIRNNLIDKDYKRWFGH